MKELTIEEKAKAYDDAIRKAKITLGCCDSTSTITEHMIYDIFPELKESKDERIRRVIRGWIYTRPSSFFDNGISKEEMLAWLEKQQKPIINVPPREVIISIWDLGNEWKELTNGSISTEHGTQLNYIQKHWHESEYYLQKKQCEQKFANKIEPKFHEGQWIVWKEKCYKVNYNGCGYEVFDQNGLSTSWGYKDVEDNAHLWTIQDAKPGDVLASKDELSILIFRNLDTSTSFSSYYNIQGKGELGWSNECFIPATKEQRDLLFRKMKEEGYEWDAEKKELKKTNEEFNGEDYGIDSLFHAKRILEKTLGKVDGYQSDDGILEHKCAIAYINKLYEQKTAWSKEDENQCINTIELVKNANDCAGILDKETALNWLKSLKERIGG